MRTQFGKRLREAREARGYTQKGLADLVGVTSNSVARTERGEQAVRWNVLERIIEKLGQPPAFYFSSEAPTIPRPKPSLAEALAVIREELGIELTPVKRPTQKEAPDAFGLDALEKAIPDLSTATQGAVRELLIELRQTLSRDPKYKPKGKRPTP